MALGLELSTWRVLGLGVAVGYAHLGVFQMGWPRSVGRELLAIDTDTDNKAGGEETADVLMPLLGARDLAMAATIYLFHHAHWDKQAGYLIVIRGMLFVTDLYAIFKKKGAKM